MKGKALKWASTAKCNFDPPTSVDYTEKVMKNVIMIGLADGDIKKEKQGRADFNTISLSDTVARIEMKETVRIALAFRVP